MSRDKLQNTEYLRKWRLANRDRFNEYQREYKRRKRLEAKALVDSEFIKQAHSGVDDAGQAI